MYGEGRAVCLGNDVDTDRIIAGRYLRTRDRALWAAHVFEDLDPTLASRLKGTVLIAGKNMGCGSSREQAVIAL
ncbi:MAG: leuD3, partial [Methanomicrobiales archaeon]|nr:leuD3 [Methanomicrobiales archaeon]